VARVRHEFSYGIAMISLVVAVIPAFSIFGNYFLEAHARGTPSQGTWKSWVYSDTHTKTLLYSETSDGSIRLIQPTKSVLEGVVTFRIEQRHRVTGVIGDVERKVLLKVQPRDVHEEGHSEIYTMKIVDRTILDLPNQAVFLDKYESNVNTTIFHDGWYTVEILYLENGEHVDSTSVDFYFENDKQPLPEPSATGRVMTETTTIEPSATARVTAETTTIEPSATARVVTDTITILVFATIASLAIYVFLRKRRGRTEGPNRSIGRVTPVTGTAHAECRAV